jgi:hypothetical protein
MRWTKVRKLVHESFAQSVRERVRVDVNNADPRGTSWQDTCKQGWIYVDGHVVAHVNPHWLRTLTLSLPATRARGRRKVVVIVEPRPEQEVPPGAEAGTFMDFPDACWEYLHSDLNAALRSADPFVASLAVLSSRVGLQRLRRLSVQKLHPLTRSILEFRMDAERDAASTDDTRRGTVAASR